MSKSRERILVIGGGPCGLGAAWRLHQAGQADWLLVESEPQPGGLAASFVESAGFTWDIGGHVMFSHYDPFSSVVDEALAGDFIEHEREAWIHLLGCYVPYPFQYNIHRLPETARDECLDGLRAAAKSAAEKPGHFGEWIDATFGPGIARHFMRPYNTKVWGRPPEKMDWRWIGERVAVPDVGRVAENIRLGRDDVSWGPNNTFVFPSCGGTGAIWRRLADKLPADRLRLNTEITAVDVRTKTCRTVSGDQLHYDRLISTMPLTKLARLAGFEEPALEATSTRILGLGLEGRPPELLRTKCWIYFADPDCPFYRVTVFSNYSPQNVPDASRFWSLMFEVQTPAGADVEELWRRTLASARDAGLVPDNAAVASQWSTFVPYSYPVPTVGRDDVLASILPRLEAVGVLSRGRFGAWKYEVGNMDHSFMQGVEAVDHILDGHDEPTLNHPDVVNRNRSTPRRRASGG